MITIAEQYSVEAYLKATGADKFSKAFKSADDSIRDVDSSSKTAGVSIGSLVKTIAGVAAAVGVFNELRHAISGAVSRYDTLNTFPKVMNQMGFSAEESEKAINRLSDGIQGLPTTLDDVASTSQQIATLTGDLEGATDTTLALNNAFLTSGSSVGDVQRGLQQYVQMLSKGEVDLQSWRTLQETMGVALNEVAKGFGFAGASAQNDLYDALQSGNVTFDEFNNKLIEINNKTGGFAETALVASGGIGTAFTNMRTAIARGVTSIIESIDSILKDSPFGSIENVINSLGDSFFNALETISNIIPVVVSGFVNVYNAIKPVLPIALGVVAAFLTFNTIIAVIAKVKIAVASLRIAMMALNATMKANPIIFVISLLVGLGLAFAVLWNQSETFRTVVTNVFNAIKAVIMPVIQTITDYIMTAWGMLVEWWNTNNQQILTTALNVWNSIVSFITPIIQTVVSFIMEIWTMLTTFWQEHGQMILQAAMNVWTVIQTVITTVVTVIWNIIQVAMTIILTIMQTIWPVVQALIVTTWNAIKNVIQGAINVITGIIQFFSALFTGNWSALWDSIKQILSGAVQAVWGLVNLWFVSKILKLGQLLFNGLKSIVTSIWNTIKSLFTSGVNVARNVVSTGFNFIRNIISTVMNFVRNLISTAWNFIRNIITTVVNGIRNTISNVFNSIRNTISNVVNAIRNTISNIFNSLKGIVSKAFNGVKSAVSNGISGAYKAVTGKMKDFLNAGKNIVGSIADGIKGAASKVTDAISNVTSKIRDFLPFSPAKEGALRDIMKIQIPQSIAESIDNGRRSAVNAMSNLSKAIYGEMPEVSNMNIAGRVANSNAKINSRVDHEINNSSESNIERLLNKIANRDTQIVMDTGELVGSTKDRYNESLGDSTKSRRRWSLA